jgi:hypothetical protein
MNNMKIKNIKLKFSTNKLNYQSFWNPIGIFLNYCFIECEGIWYHCSIKFKGNRIIVSNLQLLDDRSVITKQKEGVFEEDTNTITKFLIEILLGNHKLNIKWFNFRKHIYKRRNTIYAFLFSFLLATTYFIGNNLTNGAWMNYISGNNIIQSLFILLNIFTFGSVFFPFTIRKEMNENDIKEIFKESMIKYEENKKANERAEKRSKF